ncbi:hypothetical protein [Paenibacillus sp. FSL E2-0178]|uniref:hypothetical protein n=1 Tax=Paenibacillus sp. FSL E2-0178 TaxID=2921361 RepID=UPI0031586E44
MSIEQQRFKRAIAQSLIDTYGFIPVEATEKAFCNETDEWIVADLIWAQHMGPEYWAEVINERSCGKVKATPIKPIRPTVVEFDTEEKYLAFAKYATSKLEDIEMTESEKKFREKLKNHKRSKQRRETDNEKAALEHAVKFYAEGYEAMFDFIWEHGQQDRLMKYLYERTGASPEREVSKDTYAAIAEEIKERHKLV